MTEGILLVDKPEGWTSFDVVNKIRRIVADSENKKPKQVKVGHTGTLDPFATGLLVVMIGKSYTVQAEALSSDDKTYVFEAIIGKQSTTGDPEGDITECATPANGVDEKTMENVFKTFIGEIEQTPTSFSAIKIDGTPAYKLARQGKEVEIPTRRVTIHSLDLLTLDGSRFCARASVSKGTYIRTLVEDICKRLGTCGYTVQLRRTDAGVHSISEAITMKDDLTIEEIQKNLVQTL